MFSTNFTQEHMWSPFLMVYAITARIILIFNTSPILNIQLHSLDSLDFNCPLFKKTNIWYSYALQEFVTF